MFGRCRGGIFSAHVTDLSGPFPLLGRRYLQAAGMQENCQFPWIVVSDDQCAKCSSFRFAIKRSLAIVLSQKLVECQQVCVKTKMQKGGIIKTLPVI